MSWNGRIQTYVAVSFLLLNRVLSATDLNAPVSAMPTVGSEIRRGVDALTCRPLDFGPIEYAICVDDISTKNRQSQKVVDSRPFDTGLFFHGWLLMDIQARLRPHTEWHQSAAGAYKVFRALEKQLDLTDDQLIAASGMTKSAIEPRLAAWAAEQTE